MLSILRQLSHGRLSGACSGRLLRDFVFILPGVLRVEFLLPLQLLLVGVLDSLFVGDLAHLGERHLKGQPGLVHVNVGRRRVDTWHVGSNVQGRVVSWLRRIRCWHRETSSLAWQLEP